MLKPVSTSINFEVTLKIMKRKDILYFCRHGKLMVLFKKSDNFSPEKEGKKLTNFSLGTSYVYAGNGEMFDFLPFFSTIVWIGKYLSQ